MISLKTAEKFHGHLGPWLVLGLLMGEYGLKKIRAKKYFGAQIWASGLNKKPRSCLIDGLQLSTGCTLGKGNIKLSGGKKIKIIFLNRKNKNSACLGLKDSLFKRINKKMSHRQAENLARELAKISLKDLFKQI